MLAEFAEEPSIGDILYLELIHTVEIVAAVALFVGQSHNNAESSDLEAKIEHAALEFNYELQQTKMPEEA